jgi:hypothetical protein
MLWGSRVTESLGAATAAAGVVLDVFFHLLFLSFPKLFKDCTASYHIKRLGTHAEFWETYKYLTLPLGHVAGMTAVSLHLPTVEWAVFRLNIH